MKNIDKFLEFSESLKLARRADVEYNGKCVLDQIYTDLLPENGILKKINLPRTTIITGRKGTGKSTIFRKSQTDLNKSKENIAIYIDAKSLCDNSVPNIPTVNSEFSEEFRKYHLYSNLLKEIILKTKEKISKHLFDNILDHFTNPQLIKATVELDKLAETVNDVFITLDSNLAKTFKLTQERTASENIKIGAEIGAEIGVANAKINAEKNDKVSTTLKQEFEQTLITYLDIKNCIIEKLINIRKIVNVKRIYIFLDDFSEIEKYLQVLFIDWFIAPLNNLSEDFIKFKIATYPHRFYYGQLDNGKIDEINLDFFDAFYHYAKTPDISKMEYLALDYTKRLIENRTKIFFKEDEWLDLFSISEEKIYSILFKVSLNIPRKMGYILSYCYESCLIHGEKISKESIEAASIKYYEEVIERYFLVNKFVTKPFDEKIIIAHHYELLKTILDKQVLNHKALKTKVNKYSSHFIISQKSSSLLNCLELNGFISTYNKINLQNSFYTVYSFDYGLCKKYKLSFGTPKSKSFDKFFSNPIFNFDLALYDYFNSTQVIRCESDSSHEYKYSDLPTIKAYSMNCPECIKSNKISVCKVVNKYSNIKLELDARKNRIFDLNVNEYILLSMLNITSFALSLNKLSKYNDLSETTTLKLTKNLLEKRLIDYDKDATQQLKKDLFVISAKGKEKLIDINELIDEYKSVN